MSKKLPKAVADALDEADLPGSWEYREGRIYVGINEPFNGYPLELSTVANRIAALKVLAKYLRKGDAPPE